MEDERLAKRRAEQRQSEWRLDKKAANSATAAAATEPPPLPLPPPPPMPPPPPPSPPILPSKRVPPPSPRPTLLNAPRPQWAWDDEWHCYYNVVEAEAVNSLEASMEAEMERLMDRSNRAEVREWLEALISELEYMSWCCPPTLYTKWNGNAPSLATVACFWHCRKPHCETLQWIPLLLSWPI